MADDIYTVANKMRSLLIRNIESSNIRYQKEKNALINGIYVHVIPSKGSHPGRIRVDITAPKQSIYIENGIRAGFGGKLNATSVDLANYLNEGGGLSKDAYFLSYNAGSGSIGKINLKEHSAFSSRDAAHFIEKTVSQIRVLYPEAIVSVSSN